MNFTCISPKNNGFNYNVRFNEPIIIPENAAVQMNFAQFERDNKIRFTEAQSITLVPDIIYPTYDWFNNGAGKVGGAYRKNQPRNNTDLKFDLNALVMGGGELVSNGIVAGALNISSFKVGLIE